MPTVPLNIAGGSDPSLSGPLSSQVTRNFFPEVQADPGARSPYVLHSFPGNKAWGDTWGSKDRGMIEHRGRLYQVQGTALYEYGAGGVATLRGTIPGTARCILEGIGANVVIVTAGKAYQWDGAAVAEITDTDLETPQSVTHINNQVIYDGDGGRFVSSDVGDATSINGLNYATAESNADELIRAYAFNQTLYLFGEKTIETWYNSGTGSPPFDRIEGGIIEAGLGALHSVSHNDDFLFWLGTDGEVYRAQGAGKQRISTPALSHELRTYSRLNDAIGWCFSYGAQNYYRLTFPEANKSWMFTDQAPWVELSSGPSGGRSSANSYAYAFGKHLCANADTGRVYELDPETFDDEGAAFIRTRDTGVLHGGEAGAPGKRLEMSRLELILETGTGTLSGEGHDPQIMMSYSDDGGRTFSTERRGYLANAGDLLTRVEWFSFPSFVSRIFRFSVSDPVKCSIYSAAADIEVGI